MGLSQSESKSIVISTHFLLHQLNLQLLLLHRKVLTSLPVAVGLYLKLLIYIVNVKHVHLSGDDLLTILCSFFIRVDYPRCLASVNIPIFVLFINEQVNSLPVFKAMEVALNRLGLRVSLVLQLIIV